MIEVITDRWRDSKHILVILAHPDDPEFFCGASIARWVSEGHTVDYYLFTRGDKGSQDLSIKGEELGGIREQEQLEAASLLGVNSVTFLNYPDGELIPSLELRDLVVDIVRKEQPDVVVSCDPTNYFPKENRINHPDHRAAGQIVVDAVFPASGNPYYLRPETGNGSRPHTPDEIWLSLTSQPNVVLDVTSYWDLKLNALLKHRSQIADVDSFVEKMNERHTKDSTLENPRYEEGFRRIIFSS